MAATPRSHSEVAADAHATGPARRGATGLHLRGIARAYGARPILAGVDLEVRPGTCVALLGANGSGKTTLLRIAAGLRKADAGQAALGDGTPAPAASRAGRIAYIPQHLGLVRHASAADNAAMGAMRSMPWWRTLTARPGPAVAGSAQAALDAVGMAEHASRSVRSLSGGERQRVAIARALVQRPDVLVADEFVANLDVHQARQALALLRGLGRQGCAVLATLHDPAMALAWADQVAVLHAGRVAPLRDAREVTEEGLRDAIGG